MIKLKIFAADTGTFRFKVENQANTTEFVEVDAHVGTANQWIEISADFSGNTGTYNRLVLFPGYLTTNSDTYYMDDIKQE